MNIVVSKHAEKRIKERFHTSLTPKALAESAWKEGRIPNWGASKFLFWKWANNTNDYCDVRKFRGFFFFFYKDGNTMVLKTLYKDTGPKKKEEVKKPIAPDDPNKYLISVGLLPRGAKRKVKAWKYSL